MAFNVLNVMADTELKKLSAAIVARMKEQAHTVIECYGSVAVATGVRVRRTHIAGGWPGGDCAARPTGWQTHVQCPKRHCSRSDGWLGDSRAVACLTVWPPQLQHCSNAAHGTNT